MFVLVATLRMSLKKITSDVKFAERKSALLQNNNVWKKILPFVHSYKVAPPLHHPKNDFMCNWHLIQSLEREIYKKPTLISYILVRSKNLLVTYHTLQSLYVCVWLVNTDFNNADWISDNLHVICSRYLRTIRKEFFFQFVGQERVTNP